MPADWKEPPRPTAVYFGAQLGWSPKRESQPLTRKCKTCGGKIASGSLAYCAACTRTGFEGELAAMRKLSPLPRADRKQEERAKVEVRLTQKEIRGLMKSREGRAWLRERAIIGHAE